MNAAAVEDVPEATGAAGAERILVIGPAWVGDAVMSQALLKRLKTQQPDCVIDLLAPPWVAGVLQHMPEVHKVLTLPFAHGDFDLAGRWRFGRRLRQQRYSRAFVLPNTWKAALVPLAAGIPRRIGYLGEARYGLLNEVHDLDRGALSTTVARFAALAGPLQTQDDVPRPRLQSLPGDQQRAMREVGLERTGRPVLALCPGAEYGPAKRWPAEHFAEVARAMVKQGWEAWLFGSAKDRDSTRAVASAAGVPCHDLAGRTTLSTACDLLALADAVVTNDSGLMHVAAALDRPLVCLFGSSDPSFTPPLHPDAKVLRLGLECSPCFERVCPLGHTRCLVQIPAQQVVDALPGQLCE